jgi:hypothetical protein
LAYNRHYTISFYVHFLRLLHSACHHGCMVGQAHGDKSRISAIPPHFNTFIFFWRVKKTPQNGLWVPHYATV